MLVTFTTPFSEPLFRDGLAAGCVTTTVALAAAGRLRRSVRPVPVAGPAGALATTWVLAGEPWVDPTLAVAVLVLAAGGLALDRFPRRPLIAALPLVAGALLLAFGSGAPAAGWIRATIVASTLAGGAAVVSFESRWRATGIGPGLLFGTVVGAYLCVPDTEAVLVLLGALTPVLLLGWPLRWGSLGAGGAFALCGLLAWAVAVGGEPRAASIVGATAALGVLVVEPVVRSATVRLRVPTTAVALVVVHALTVVVAARGIGLGEGAGPATLLAALLAVAAGMSLRAVA